MNATVAATAIAAVLSTIITALWAQTHWSAQAKRATSGVVAIILGTAIAIATNQIAGVPEEWSAAVTRWLVIVGTIAVGAQGLYLQFKGVLSKLEDATTTAPADTAPADVEGTEGLPAEDAAA